ncbi:alpha-beta hydrolase superfamily lysophospholipase [Isoptericola jiangsuensis]|uniref:Alpha-beta hydrolase superfamily lysophospholipase n=1 Tax=Isoptericola jiangsuensis TaxID=548579 RepID=A0A2A9EUZ7_9MICO|nr:alpha/beta fold hydrolase [Isoptericola jiangsuensis]PFG42065.1 alpha-beta hydrolase superfamily lysophospholipase [Isoptericola jiangsuensis]
MTESSTPRRPVVFVHGLWLHADSWTPWVDRYAEAGYAPTNPGWPGDSPTVEETREHPDRVGGHGIDDVVAHHVEIIAGLAAPPVVVGHSFGGLIAQRLLAEGHAAAAVAIDPAPMRGNILLPPSSLKVASVALRNPAHFSGAVALTPDEFRYGFANELADDEAAALYDQWTIPSPGRPLFEDAAANLLPGSPARVDTHADRGPLLLVAGGMDHTVPPSLTRTAAKLYRKHSPAVTDLIELPDRGHSLTIDHGWAEVADATLAWLKEKGL